MRPLDVDEPTVMGPYRLLGRLGSGGMGRVYLGRSAGGRTVAVKIVHPHFALDEEFRARFRREVEAARRVGGAWTAPVLDADPEARVPWVATAYAAGPSLTAAVADGGPLPAHSVRALGAGLGEALAAVHELGLVHRDVKPSNVLLTLDGPLLIDFGIARATDGTASLTSTGVSIGSPGYMSPEQILGKGVTGAADVFSLGAVLAFAATGRPPFPGDSSAALLYKVVHEEPELGTLDGEVRELVRQCLAKDAGPRPAPGEVARRLAPDGAARLVAGGWLPGTLVEQVSRGAVQLLNLEAAGEGGPVSARGSGPVDFSRSSVQAGTGPTGAEAPVAPTTGAFGPPPVMPGPPGPADSPAPAGSHGSADSPARAGTYGSAGAPVHPVTSAPADFPAPAGSYGSAGVPAYPGAPPPADSPASAGTHGSAGVPVHPGTSAPADFPAPAGSYGSAGVPAYPGAPPPADSPASAGTYGSAGAPAYPAAPPAPAAVPGARDAGRGAGKLSVQVAAASTRGGDGRGRRLSCTVALAVAGALAAVTVGSVFLFDLLPGDRRDTAGGGDADRAGRAPSSPASTGGGEDTGGSGGGGPSPSAPGDAAGTVPAAYLGTWEGEGTALGGTLPAGTFRVTLKEVSVGQELGRLRQTDQLGGVCVDVLTLKQVTEKQLVAASAGAEGNHSGCNQSPTTVRFTPVGDDLAYASESAGSGKPEARLSKVG